MTLPVNLRKYLSLLLNDLPFLKKAENTSVVKSIEGGERQTKKKRQ